jgi:hypothetical protein
MRYQILAFAHEEDAGPQERLIRDRCHVDALGARMLQMSAALEVSCLHMPVCMSARRHTSQGRAFALHMHPRARAWSGRSAGAEVVEVVRCPPIT